MSQYKYCIVTGKARLEGCCIAMKNLYCDIEGLQEARLYRNTTWSIVAAA